MLHLSFFFNCLFSLKISPHTKLLYNSLLFFLMSSHKSAQSLRDIFTTLLKRSVMGPGGPGGPGPGGPGGPGFFPPIGGPGGPGFLPPIGGFFSGFSDMICSCLSCLCCCWLLRDCFGGPPPQAPPLLPPYY